jgi:transmembrane protein
MASLGIQPVWLVSLLTIAVELIGSILILSDRAVWLGAGMLGVFTLLTIPLTHHFWTMSGPEAAQAMIESEEHVTVLGGLVGIAILSYVRQQLRAAKNGK